MPGIDLSNKWPGFPPITIDKGIGSFSFFVMGGRSSGKTIFLASLYNELMVMSPERGYCLRPTDTAKRNYLTSVINSLISEDQTWPKGTPSPEIYLFDGYRPTPQRTDLFQLRFEDFPGAAITRPVDWPMVDLSQSLEHSHIILMLLDGEALLAAQSKSRVQGIDFYSTLRKLAEYAQSCSARPLHFAVSKWDNFRDPNSVQMP